MTEQLTKAQDSEVLQILITEHTNLQAVCSATVFEANGRTSLFLGTVSSAVVALAFVGQISEMGTAFYTFAFILLPSILFVGVVTFVRVYQTGIEHMISARGINRIRHYYTEIAPQMKSYFILSTHDDMQGMLKNMGGRANRWQLFFSTAGLVSVINSILAAVFVGLLAFMLISATLVICIVVGVVIFAASIGLHLFYQDRRWQEVEKSLDVLFPSESESLE